LGVEGFIHDRQGMVTRCEAKRAESFLLNISAPNRVYSWQHGSCCYWRVAVMKRLRSICFLGWLSHAGQQREGLRLTFAGRSHLLSRARPDHRVFMKLFSQPWTCPTFTCRTDRSSANWARPTMIPCLDDLDAAGASCAKDSTCLAGFGVRRRYWLFNLASRPSSTQ